jgi:predicted phage tail protein
MRTRIRLHGKLEKIFGSDIVLSNIRKPRDVVKALDTKFPNFKKEVMEMEKRGIFFQILFDDEALESAHQLDFKKQITNVDIAPCIVGSGPIAAVAAIFGGAALMGGATIFGLSAGLSFALGLNLVLAGITFLMSAPDDITPEDQEASVRGESFYFSSQANASVQGSAVPLNYGLLRVGSKVVSNTLRNYDREDYIEPVRTTKGSTTVKGLAVRASQHRQERRKGRSGQGAQGYRAVRTASDRRKGGSINRYITTYDPVEVYTPGEGE